MARILVALFLVLVEINAKKLIYESVSGETVFPNALAVKASKAIDSDESATLKKILSSGLSVNVKGRGGISLLAWAYKRKARNCFQLLLLRGADPNVTDESGDAIIFMLAEPLQYTSENLITDDAWFMKELLKYRPNLDLYSPRRGETALMIAASSSNTEKVNALIQAGARINEKSKFDGSTALIQALQLRRFAVVLTLLENGANIHLKDHLKKSGEYWLRREINTPHMEPTHEKARLILKAHWLK